MTIPDFHYFCSPLVHFKIIGIVPEAHYRLVHKPLKVVNLYDKSEFADMSFRAFIGTPVYIIIDILG